MANTRALDVSKGEVGRAPGTYVMRAGPVTLALAKFLRCCFYVKFPDFETLSTRGKSTKYTQGPPVGSLWFRP